jgi:hypothetical protein
MEHHYINPNMHLEQNHTPNKIMCNLWLHQGVPSAETKGFVMSAEDNGETRKKS